MYAKAKKTEQKEVVHGRKFPRAGSKLTKFVAVERLAERSPT
jgi:hypothetical protein